MIGPACRGVDIPYAEMRVVIAVTVAPGGFA